MIDLELSQLNEIANNAYLANNLPLAHAVSTLADIREAMENADIDSIEDMNANKVKLESKIEALESKLAQFESFFDDCVQSLNAHWPCAEIWDNNLQQVIFDAIAKGDTNENSN